MASYRTSNGQDALIPAAGIGDYSQIQLYVKQLISNNPVVNEAASVVILNGGNTTGLASAEATVLTDKGMEVSSTADAPASVSGQATNVIIDNSNGKAPATLSALKDLFGTTTATNASLSANYPSANFIVILGTNQQMPANATITNDSSLTTSQ